MLPHQEHERFHAAIMHTAVETGFQPHLIEKDYYCTQILKILSSLNNNPLIFKGGTLLAKCYAGFYRLSEDLDFSLSTPGTCTRNERSKLIKPVKNIIIDIPNIMNVFTVEKPLTGSNESKQYKGSIQYQSCLNKTSGRILIEIGLRESLLTPSTNALLNTLLVDSFSNKAIEQPIIYQCLSKQEAYAEKMRAALCRDKLAIRDFYDIHYAMKKI